jgi:hypothetical protein
MNYMHLLVGHPTQNSKKFEVCYVLGDTAYVRPKRLKEDAKLSFIDWPDTVLGRLRVAYDRVPLRDDRDSVLVDYRKLVGCLKDAFIVLTDGSYEPSELFEETCLDSDLRRVFIAALGVFGLSNLLKLKTNDVWNLLEDLDVSVHKIPDKVVFNRLQECYFNKGFSVFALSETSESNSVSFEQTTSLLDDSLVSLATATSELENDAIKTSEGFESEVVALDEAITSTSEEHQLNSLYYSEALSEVAVEDAVKPILWSVTDGDPKITYVKQSLSDLKDSEVSGVYIADAIKSPVFTWPADNAEFRALPSREQLEKYAVENEVPLFDMTFKEDTVKLPDLDVPKKDTFYVESSDGSVLNRGIPKKDTFYVEPLPKVRSEEDISVLDTDTPKKDTFYMEPIRKKGDFDSPFFYSWCKEGLLANVEVCVTDNKSSLQDARLEVLLDRLPPKDVLKNVYVDYGPLRGAVQLCLLQDFFDVRVMVDNLLTLFDAIGRGDYVIYDDLRCEKIKSLRSGLVRCLLEIKGTVVSPLWNNQTDDLLGFDVTTVQRVLTNLIKIYGRNEGTIERWFTVSDETKRLIKQALSYVSDDTMFVKVPVSLKHTEFSDWLTEKECDALSQLLFFDAKKTDWYRSKAIEKEVMERYKDCSLLPLDFLKDDTVTSPSRYRKNNIEAWDFTIQSLLPHPLATVAEYVIRYPYKGGREDLEKALAWAKKAEQSLPYLQVTVGYGDSVVDDLPVVDADMFPDCSEGQRDVLRAVQKATLALRGSLGYGEPEDALRDVTNGVKTLLEEL